MHLGKLLALFIVSYKEPGTIYDFIFVAQNSAQCLLWEVFNKKCNELPSRRGSVAEHRRMNQEVAVRLPVRAYAWVGGFIPNGGV